MSAWENVKEPSKKTSVTFDDIKRLIDGFQRDRKAGTCAVFYGERGTGKTGAAIDCRTEEEKKQGKKVLIIDVDGNAKDTVSAYWKNDLNVMLVDPLILVDEKVDPLQTYETIKVTVQYAKSIQSELKCIIFDGLDRFLKICEDVMRQEYLHIPIGQRVAAFDWGIRNELFDMPLYLMRTLNTMRIFITHMKVPMKLVQGHLVEGEARPDFQRQFPNSVVQELYFEKVFSNGVTTMKATVKKSNSKIELEGRQFIIGTNSKEGAKWNGLKEFYKELGDFQ